MLNKLNLKNKCPECNSNIIHDNIKGEFFCGICGYVIEEKLEDFGSDCFINSSFNMVPSSGVRGTNSISYHDYGLHTEIDFQGRDYTGKHFDENVKKSITNLRKWNNIIRISNSKERRLSNVLAKINEICSILSFPKVVCETAALIYRNYENKCDTKGKSSICMAAASIFYACKICSILRSLNEIIKICGSQEDFNENLKLSSKYYRSMVMICEDEKGNENTIKQSKLTEWIKKEEHVRSSLGVQAYGITNIQSININQYISKLANLAKFDTKIERLALEIAKKTQNHLLSDGKSPNGIAAAYLYLASVLLGVNILQMDISKLSGVTEVTIRNRCKDILTSFKITLKIRPNAC